MRDHGIGILDADKDKLFEPFALIAHGRQMNPSGIGLGLSCCKEILKKIGGDVWLDHSSPEGSTFKFRMALWDAGTGPIPEND